MEKRSSIPQSVLRVGRGIALAGLGIGAAAGLKNEIPNIKARVGGIKDFAHDFRNSRIPASQRKNILGTLNIYTNKRRAMAEAEKRWSDFKSLISLGFGSRRK